MNKRSRKMRMRLRSYKNGKWISMKHFIWGKDRMKFLRKYGDYLSWDHFIAHYTTQPHDYYYPDIDKE